MNKQLYDIPRADDLAVIRAWAAVADNRSSVITVGVGSLTHYQLVVYDQPWDETNISRAEAVLGSMIVRCDWPE